MGSTCWPEQRRCCLRRSVCRRTFHAGAGHYRPDTDALDAQLPDGEQLRDRSLTQIREQQNRAGQTCLDCAPRSIGSRKSVQLLDGLMEKASNLTEEQAMASVRDGVPSLVVRRFNAFAMASDMQGAAHYLRGLVQMLRWICSTSSSRKTRRGYVWRGDGISTGRERTKQRKRRKEGTVDGNE